MAQGLDVIRSEALTVLGLGPEDLLALLPDLRSLMQSEPSQLAYLSLAPSMPCPTPLPSWAPSSMGGLGQKHATLCLQCQGQEHTGMRATLPLTQMVCPSIVSVLWPLPANGPGQEKDLQLTLCPKAQLVPTVRKRKTESGVGEQSLPGSCTASTLIVYLGKLRLKGNVGLTRVWASEGDRG